MKILISGIGGFVAEHFVNFIKKENIEAQILGLDITDNINLDYKDFIYKKVDLKNFDLVKYVINDFKPDYILHLAAISSVSQSWIEPCESFVNNTNIFLNIIESIRELKLKTRVLSVGSSEEYGNQPIENMPLKETSRISPCNPYAAARISQEMLSEIYAKYYDIDIIMTRSFNHIGPKQKPIFAVPSFIKQLCEIKKGNQDRIKVGNLEIIRDFLDIRDVVRAYWLLVQKGRKGQIYNVCSNNGVKLKEIIDIVSKKLEINPIIEVDKSKIRPDDNMIIIGDNTKLKKEVDWHLEYTIEETLQEMINENIGENYEKATS